MKRNYTALALALCLSLAGCGKKSEAPKKDEKPAKAAATTKDEAYEPEKDKAAAEKALFESDNEDKRNAALEDASDYIALVELSTNANGQMELEFIKNYKGMLSTVELPVPKGMTPNQEYIIFYRDGADGVVGPVHPTYGYYAVDGSDDPLLRHMERTYGDLDEDEEDTSSVKSKKDADAYDEDSYGSSKDSSSEKSSSSSKKSSSKTSSSKESTKSSSDTKKSSSQSKSSSDSKKSSKKSSSDE